MIDPHTKVIETKPRQYFTRGCADLRFDNHRTRPKHIDVALVKLAKPSTRGPIRAPNRLDLITLKKLRQLVAILRHHTRQRNRQVVTQSKIGFASSFMYAALEYFEDQLVSFFAILAHQRFDVFRGRRFQWFKT